VTAVDPYRLLARPVLFRLGHGDPEVAHERTLRALTGLSGHPAALRLLARRYAVQAPRTVFGVRFPNPVGLAAGMDKDGVALPAWPALGFGFVEVGTVTWHPQPGNPRPRVTRLPASGAVVNRMGFNNHGARALAARLERLERQRSDAGAGPLPVPLGISLGKSRITPVDDAVEDYLRSLRALSGHADYVAVNVSSPNTPGLRSLQDREALTELLTALVAEAAELAGGGRPAVPLLVKVAPDLTDEALAELVAVCLDTGVAGVIATNTTLARSGVDPAERTLADQPGGLSGRPLTERARQVVSFIQRETSSSLPVIGVGGIMTVDDALRMLDAGASLVQLYTGLLYAGPRLVRTVAERAGSR
jgi:dihydroorotate dehydrogenase